MYPDSGLVRGGDVFRLRQKGKCKRLRRRHAAPPDKKLKLAFVSNNAANFWSFARAGCNAAAKELGDVDVDFRITQDGSSAAQRQILDDLVAKGEDGIAVSVNDPDNQTEFLEQDRRRRRCLICCDSDAAASKRVCLHRHGQRGRRRRGRENDQGMPAQRRQNHAVRRTQRRAKRQGTLRRHQKGAGRLEHPDHRHPHRRHRRRPRAEKRRGHAGEISRHRLPRRPVELQRPGDPERRSRRGQNRRR